MNWKSDSFSVLKKLCVLCIENNSVGSVHPVVLKNFVYPTEATSKRSVEPCRFVLQGQKKKGQPRRLSSMTKSVKFV